MSNIKNSDMPSAPIAHRGFPSLGNYVIDQPGLCIGLTKRERFAMEAMKGLLSFHGSADYSDDSVISRYAVLHADLLLAELEKGNE